MQDYEKVNKKENQWRSSQGRMKEATPQGRMKEATPQGRKDDGEHLTGYQASEEERQRKTAPREMARMSGSFGDMAVGADKDKKLSITVSERRSQQDNSTLEDKKSVRSTGAHRLSGTRGKAFTNPHDREESAVLYRDAGTQPPYFMKRRFKRMMGSREQALLDSHVPFLDVSREQEEQNNLIQQEKALRKVGGDSRELSTLLARRSELQQIISEKATQERRFQQTLQQAKDRAETQRIQGWDALDIQHQGEENEEEDGEERPEDESGEG